MKKSRILLFLLFVFLVILLFTLNLNFLNGGGEDLSKEECTRSYFEGENEFFIENKKLYICPSTRLLKGSPGEVLNFGILIKNLAGEGQDNLFSYEVTLSNQELINSCEVDEEEFEKNLILASEKDISINPEEEYYGEISIKIPKKISNCDLRYQIEVFNGGDIYATELMDILIRA